MDNYELDPVHYCSVSGLAWDAMLKYTNIELELLTDEDMFLFIDGGSRGGINQCCNRYAKANNQYMGEFYKEKEDSKYIMYYEANNLYGWAMTQPLPYGGFKWVENEALEKLETKDIPYNSNIGYILEVDLEYPESIHDAHQDLLFCAEHRAPPGSKQKKLMTTLYDKQNYIIHYRPLKQALNNGLVLKKIHKVLQFDQKPWLKPFINFNTEKRKNTRNKFEERLFKLINNSVCGKSMQNEQKYITVKLVNEWEGEYGGRKLIEKSDVHSCTIFGDKLAALQLKQTQVKISKPVYIGMSILDISKYRVYYFHYEFMRKLVGDNCKVLYTHTDSLIYEITKKNIYKTMRKYTDEFDTSKYQENNQFKIRRKNKMEIGLMKDVCEGIVIEEFVGLKGNTYSIKTLNDEEPIVKASGIKASAAKLTFNDYIECSEKERTHISRTAQHYSTTGKGV